MKLITGIRNEFGATFDTLVTDQAFEMLDEQFRSYEDNGSRTKQMAERLYQLYGGQIVRTKCKRMTPAEMIDLVHEQGMVLWGRTIRISSTEFTYERAVEQLVEDFLRTTMMGVMQMAIEAWRDEVTRQATAAAPVTTVTVV